MYIQMLAEILSNLNKCEDLTDRELRSGSLPYSGIARYERDQSTEHHLVLPGGTGNP